MASLSSLPLSISLSFWVLLISPANSLTCTSQTFTSNRTFTNCTDLPTLNCYLHYTYNISNSSFSVAFIAAPPKSDGWVGWGINPNATGMVGGQVLIAMKVNGTVTPKTYSLDSYQHIKEGKLSFDVWDMSAESDSKSGNFTIFASMKVPEKVESLHQIWQVGPTQNGKPAKHDFAPANLQANGTLALVGAASTTPAPTPAPTATSNSTTDNGKSEAGRIRDMNVGLHLGLFVALFSFVVGFLF